MLNVKNEFLLDWVCGVVDQVEDFGFGIVAFQVEIWLELGSDVGQGESRLLMEKLAVMLLRKIAK